MIWIFISGVDNFSKEPAIASKEPCASDLMIIGKFFISPALISAKIFSNLADCCLDNFS